MISFILKLRTAYALGIVNSLRVLIYRVGLKSGISSVQRLKSTVITGTFFNPPVDFSFYAGLTCNFQWKENQSYFGWFSKTTSEYPNWHENPFNNRTAKSIGNDWWQIDDFDDDVGDIKTIWEASRFDWVITLSQSAAKGNTCDLEKLNNWLIDWYRRNPAYKGPNWKCGQEASIRVMHLAIAASILAQHKNPTDSLQKLINVHLKRIAPTMNYAIAQNNNHGTSEAAALFIGGSWLFGHGDKRALQYQTTGRKWLENRASRLIESDGTFSQYSVNYHRVMLDTYSMAEYWRRLLDLPRFSDLTYRRLNAAVNWLYQMTQFEENGDAPNLGANDGARLLPLTGTDFRDYRPTIQLASVLFCNERAFGADGDWNLPLRWLKLEMPEKCKPKPKSCYFSNGGYGLLRNETAFALFNIPQFQFRPSQADALHVDLWLEGQNILRDGGTYSYNATDDFVQYFGGTASHNTIEFDDRDQMPRLSRFLLGSWLKTNEVVSQTDDGEKVSIAAGYRDYKGACHHRSVILFKNKLRVVDKISGFKEKAVLRWRLQPGNWRLTDNGVCNGDQILTVKSDVAISRFEMTDGLESRYYMQKTNIPVLEIEVNKSCNIISEYVVNR